MASNSMSSTKPEVKVNEKPANTEYHYQLWTRTNGASLIGGEASVIQTPILLITTSSKFSVVSIWFKCHKSIAAHIFDFLAKPLTIVRGFARTYIW